LGLPSTKEVNIMVKSSKPDGAQFLQFFGPLLDALRTLGGSASGKEAVEQVARDIKMPDAAQNELMSSGSPRFPNQVAWARFYLSREGLLDSSKRGVWSLTKKGWATKLSHDDARQLFAKWVKVFAAERKRRQVEEEPEEAVAEATGAVPHDYRDALLGLIRELPPDGFERLCQRLLRESGFIQVVVTGRSRDEGIDGFGTLQINPFVSFKVLFQCKRYRSSVSPSQVRDFRGAMQGRADKGIIITTGTFTAEAQREAARDGAPPIELVDSEGLITMFEQLEIGLRPVQTFQIDPAFFQEFQKKSEA
jgi:restriction system protein